MIELGLNVVELEYLLTNQAADITVLDCDVLDGVVSDAVLCDPNGCLIVNGNLAQRFQVPTFPDLVPSDILYRHILRLGRRVGLNRLLLRFPSYCTTDSH